MKKTIIIVGIIVFSTIAICLGILIALTPDPIGPAPVDIHEPNSIVSEVGIERPDTSTERLIAIRTYNGKADAFDDLVKIAQFGRVEYLVLDDKSDDYLLIMPFEIKGKMILSSLKYDTFNEVYVKDETKSSFECNSGKELPDGYCLLLRYTRPTTPEYQLKLFQEDEKQTATYQIVNMENGSPVKTTQLVKDDKKSGTESFGKPITIKEEGKD